MRIFASLFHQLQTLGFKKVCDISHCRVVLGRKISNWNIVGAVYLERKPVITQLLTPLEKKYYKYLLQLELEKSYLSDHEKRHLIDIKSAEKVKKGDLEDIDAISKQTAQDFEDACLEEFNKYKPASRVTVADEKNDHRSVQRKLDSSLVFVVQHKLGNDIQWMLPQAIHMHGETLRQTAERALRSVCASPLKVQFMGNAPVGFYKYKYPKAARQGSACGAKVFFFKAQLLEKRLSHVEFQKTESVLDAMWLTHSEIRDSLKVEYGKAIQSFLFPDTFDLDTPPHYTTVEEDPQLKSSALN